MTPSEAQAYCAAVTKRSGSNFYYSFLFLPPARRDAMYAVYAFCREVDSVVDDAPPGSDPREQLQRWRDELNAAYLG
ncbi:MAG: squalene synthase HpnD, partial [Nitrospirae bacterium]